MNGLSWHDDFRARVNYAAEVIADGRRTCRRFDSTCENDDGDAVAAALVRRAQANPSGKLAANLWRYMCRETCEPLAALFAGQDLDQIAAEMRAKAKVTK